MKMHIGHARRAVCLLDISIRCGSVGSFFTLQLLHPMGKQFLAPSGQEAGWASELVWM